MLVTARPAAVKEVLDDTRARPELTAIHWDG